MNLSHYKKFIEGGNYSNAQIEKMADQYSQEYRESISVFDIVIMSERADTIYMYGDETQTPYKALVDFNIKPKNSSLNRNLYKKEIRTKHSDGFLVGNVIEIENKNSLEKQICLLTSHIESKEGYDLNIAESCNYNLKFQSSDYQIQSIPCVLYNSSSTTDGTDTDKVMRLPYGKIGMLIQANEFTKEFARDKRFLIKDEAWIIEFIGKLQDGIYDIVLTESQIEANDRLDLGIADYTNATITIETVETLSLNTGNTYQLTPIVKVNDSVVTSPTLTYTSANTTIVTVDSNGLITAVTDGVCNVEIKYGDTVKIVSLQVNAVVFDNFTCEIIGESSIINNQTKTYTVKWLNNGVEIVDSIASVNLSDNSLATATFTENTISITADRINKGMVTITVTSTTNGIIGTKDIEIKGLW